MKNLYTFFTLLNLIHQSNPKFVNDLEFPSQVQAVIPRAVGTKNRFNFIINSDRGGRSENLKGDKVRNIIPSGRTIVDSGRLINAHLSKYQIRLIHNITQILDNLLFGYDNRLRPGYGRQPATVNVDIMIRSMGSISEMNMDFTMSMYFRQRWRDERLAFEGPVKMLPVSIKILEQIWKPDTYFHNGKESYVHSLTVPNRFLRIDKNGSILYSTRLTVKARCPMDLGNFPMDQQYCPLIMGSFGYDVKDIIYKWRPTNPVALSEGLTFSQFEMINIKTEEIQHQSPSRNSSMLGVRFHFRRHIGYFLLQIYLPCILIVILSWVSFWINREATADRVGLSITSVLALSAFFLDARSDLPKSPYPTRLDKFVFVCLFYVSATLLEFAGVHYYTKFGTGELFLSELLDVKLGYLPGVKDPSLKRTSQFPSRNKSAARSSTLRRRFPRHSREIPPLDSGTQARDHSNVHTDEKNDPSNRPQVPNYHDHTNRANEPWYLDKPKGSQPNLKDSNHGFMEKKDQRSEKAQEFKFNFPGRDLMSSLLRVLRMLLHCHMNVLTKLWGCVAGKPKWSGGPNGHYDSQNLSDGEGLTNSVSVLDRFSKILFPLSFLVYNFFYWKPYFSPTSSDRGEFTL